MSLNAQLAATTAQILALQLLVRELREEIERGRGALIIMGFLATIVSAAIGSLTASWLRK